jgi:hypothetical protein
MAQTFAVDFLAGMMSGGVAKTVASPWEAMKLEAQVIGTGARFEALPCDLRLISRLAYPTFLNIFRCVFLHNNS